MCWGMWAESWLLIGCQQDCMFEHKIVIGCLGGYCGGPGDCPSWLWAQVELNQTRCETRKTSAILWLFMPGSLRDLRAKLKTHTLLGSCATLGMKKAAVFIVTPTSGIHYWTKACEEEYKYLNDNSPIFHAVYFKQITGTINKASPWGVALLLTQQQQDIKHLSTTYLEKFNPQE